MRIVTDSKQPEDPKDPQACNVFNIFKYFALPEAIESRRNLCRCKHFCSGCGKSGGRKELDVREWQCLFCNATHDRDLNASINLNRWADGQSDQDKNERGVSVSLAVPAVYDEALTAYKQLSLF